MQDPNEQELPAPALQFEKPPKFTVQTAEQRRQQYHRLKVIRVGLQSRKDLEEQQRLQAEGIGRAPVPKLKQTSLQQMQKRAEKERRKQEQAKRAALLAENQTKTVLFSHWDTLFQTWGKAVLLERLANDLSKKRVTKRARALRDADNSAGKTVHSLAYYSGIATHQLIEELLAERSKRNHV